MLHDGFHPRLDFLDLVEAELVDVVGRAVGGGAGLQRPAVISVAVLEVPNARVRRRDRAMLLQFLDLALERGDDLGRHRLGDAVDQLVVRQAGFGQLLAQGRDDRRLIGLFGSAAADDADRLVEVEAGRDHADPAVVLQALGLAIDIAAVGIDPIGEGERIVGGGDRVPAFEEIGQIGVAAAELVHDIRRVAKAVVGIEHERIAEREGVAGLRDLMRLERDRAVERVGLGQVRKIEAAERLQPLADMLLARRDAGWRLVLPLVRKRRQLALGDAEDGRVLGIFGEKLVGDALELVGEIAFALSGGTAGNLAA